MKTKRLGDLAAITTGVIIQRLKVESGEEAAAYYPAMSLRAFNIEGMRRDDLDVLATSRELKRSDLTAQGEVVLRATSPFGARCISKEETGIIVPHFFFRIAPRRISGSFLAAWLNSEDVRGLLALLAEGTAIVTIKRQRLLEIEVPVLTREQQQRFAEIDGLAREEKRLQGELADCRFMMAQAALSQMSRDKNQKRGKSK